MPAGRPMATTTFGLTIKLDFCKMRDLPGGAVAQFGRALEWHSRGRQFDPGQLHHSKYPNSP